MPFDDKSMKYCSLVDLVKGKYPFDHALQVRAAQFLKSLEPQLFDQKLAEKLVHDLVPTSAGSPSGFVKSILTLLSSPHTTIVAAALSLLNSSFYTSSPFVQIQLVESDLVTNVLAIVQPHTLPISGNEEIISNLDHLIRNSTNLALPSHLTDLAITTTIEKYNHREMIFQKIVLPSSQFVTFLISNRHVLGGDLLYTFMSLLSTLITIGPFHLPTLEFVVASPIVTAFSSCLLSVANDGHLWRTLDRFTSSLLEWKKGDNEVVQCGKRMMQALISEGFDDTLEQTLMRKKEEFYGFSVANDCLPLSKLMGSNVRLVTPNLICGLSSDVGNTLIAGADEQTI
ncbi:hypothetical protein BLNAU_14143 [Blattamonas nauphoetae]|uniref:Uncharacterized protein n=1 Tax=Blattamonas nauphoetae TaxID=2049346 RepID=A0ABQ9XK18_9EUKA|nr:hypothetical protein BLNAU_14143 [Blattamonas nauphoetae]